MIRLGLIGDNIAASSSPRFHGIAGELTGQPVQYDRLVPKAEGTDFDGMFQRAMRDGYRGLNITYPYKEQVMPFVTDTTEAVRAIGAINTVRFDGDRVEAFNTDYSGFTAGYRDVRGDAPTGFTALIGCGGVGRAIAFALADMGAPALRLFDRDPARAEGLARDLASARPVLSTVICATPEEAASGAQGICNGTPVGMVGYDGTPVPAPALQQAEWVFDAIYTPLWTQFLQDARDAGAKIITGWDLFFWQALHSWDVFSGGKTPDVQTLRDALGK